MKQASSPIVAFLILSLTVLTNLRAQITDLVSFDGTNGYIPYGGVVLSADGSTLYGTTREGGAINGSSGYGEVYSEPVGGGTPTILATFNGTTTGKWPDAGLTLSADGSTLYGTTLTGGANGDGEVFSLPVTGGTPTVLASFNGTNGANPYYGGLTLNSGILYGTTTSGGANGDGDVFSIPVNGNAITVLASFNGTNGSQSQGRLLVAGNTLYGTTSGGGANNFGAVFSLPVGGGTIAPLASFNSTNGSGPTGGLILTGGILYGTTNLGGPNSGGEIFSLPVAGGTPTVLFGFTSNNAKGFAPVAGLTLSPDASTLYGTTYGGGANGFGEVFSEPVSGGTPTIQASFNYYTSGGSPAPAQLALSSDGKTLYGTSQGGGSGGDGVVFTVPAPEPGTATFLLSGLLALAVRRRAAVSAGGI